MALSNGEMLDTCRTVNHLSTSGTGRPEGIRDPRLEGRGGHQHDVDFFDNKGMATLNLAGVHHGPRPRAAEKASIDAYATSWARGLGLLEE
jgi:hypothetical protein